MATIRDRIVELWGRLDKKQKLLVGGLAILFILVVALSLTTSKKVSYAIAYSGLSTEDAAAIVARLQEQGIPYEVSAGESIVKVPADKVHAVRLDMASAGLPSGGTVGFEVFDSTNLGMTDFTQQLNYRRALEGELGRTIASLEAVEQARVHIVIPQPTIYSDLEKPPTASVLVKLRPGGHLNEGQVIGITHLVSTSVEGLQPENITIVDTKGTVLNDGLTSPDGRVSDDRFRAQQTYERAIADKVQAMLETVLGPQRAVVSVSADLDWSQTETSTEAYQPPTDGTPVVRSAREMRESYSGTPTSAEGVPGVDSNLPSVPSYSGTTAGQPGAQQTPAASEGSYQRSDLTYNYELSKVVSHTVDAPGKVKKLNVSVLLDTVTDDQQLESIRQAVIAAAGIDAERGDSIIVETVAFDRSYFTEQELAMAKAAREQQYMGAARWGAIVVAALVVILLARGVIVRATTPLRPAVGAAGTNVLMPTPEGLEDSTTALQLASGETITLPPGQQHLPESMQRQHQIVTIAQKQPEIVAQVIQFWLNDKELGRRQA
ncbi:MAG: flagellar basal-body MS-ring/collar protein FliF [Anaerolineae bacterium]